MNRREPGQGELSEASPDGDSSTLMHSTRAMAGGTITSRLTGMLREPVVGAALGTGLLGDAYGVANVVPNILYILLVGGVLNAVFVPQLVRHMADDPDGGDGYADRLITLVGTVLLVVTILAVLLAPYLVRIYATPRYTQQQLDLATAFARLCLPQIFFYGVYTMLSQVLNARGRFGAPMFAPIANNIVAIATFGLFIVVAGPAAGADGELTSQEVLLLGIGTTLGVVVQAPVAAPLLSM